MCSIHQLLKHHVPIKKECVEEIRLFFGIYVFLSFFRFEERKEIGQNVTLWLDLWVFS